MHIRAQNAGLVVRKLPSDIVQFEAFEVSPQNTMIMKTTGKLLCSYPGPAIRVPAEIFENEFFLRELCSFLVQMDVDCLDATPTTSKGGSVVKEVRESVHPRYISELLMGILGGCGQPADVDRITKRIGDEVLWDDAYKPWRRSPLWLTLRVSLQSSLRGNDGGDLYKHFMLFFHAYLLRICVSQGFSSELLYAMRVKTTRRLSKLGPAVSRHVFEFVHDISKKTEELLSKRWTVFQAKGSISPTLQPKGLDVIGDTGISLKNSHDYLSKTLRSALQGFPQMRFTPPHDTRLNTLRDFTQFANGQLKLAIDKDRHIAIADFELIVERNLESWVAASKSNDDAPDVIASCIQQYCNGAKGLYGTNPEDNSIMILTIMDLWVALDTIATWQCPLMKQYSPEIPSAFIHPLLLHRSSTLKRALRIEEYLCRRHAEAGELTSIFSNCVNGSSFSVKYFRASKHLQRLYDDVIAFAEQERASKRAELDSLNKKYKSLLSEASDMDHKWLTNTRWDTHSATCQKCQLEKRAEALEIHIHEWPLSELEVLAQRTVFELSPPCAFSAWRDITYMILRDLGLSSISDSKDWPKMFLHSFSGLQRWSASLQKHYRLTIGSTTKSFSDQSHYKTVGIPADESSVLVNNGLSFELFDCIRSSWTIESFAKSSVKELCTPPIPSSSPYHHLHSFVSGTQHTSNDIIASQSDCPEEITLHEFLAFSGLRSGPRLQWLNIARELASPYLSFRREEVHTLVTQAAWQLGSLSDGVREWHVDLSISSFGNALLRELESLLETIRTNWLEEVTVRTIGALDNSDPDSSSCLISL
jgi:DNA-binding transcriptional ArsR family regulator